MPLGNRLLTLPYDVAYQLLRYGVVKPARMLARGGTGSTLKIPLNATESIARFGWKHPVVLGGSALAAGDALDRAKGLESSIRSNRMGLSYAKFSSCSNLDLFEQKKTYLSEKVAFEKFAFMDQVFGGVAEGLGKGVVDAGFSQIGKLVGGAARSIKERMILNKQREEIVDNIMTNDPIVSVFEQESPGSTIQAYATMVRIAPMLSTDPNIVTSFLRNTAQTGGTMDFATVKLLADAEISVAKARYPEDRWSLREGKKS